MSNLSFDKPQNFALNIHCRSMWFPIEDSERMRDRMNESVEDKRTSVAALVFSNNTIPAHTHDPKGRCVYFGVFFLLVFIVPFMWTVVYTMLLLVNSGKIYCPSSRIVLVVWPARSLYWAKIVDRNRWYWKRVYIYPLLVGLLWAAIQWPLSKILEHKCVMWYLMGKIHFLNGHFLVWHDDVLSVLNCYKNTLKYASNVLATHFR